MKKILIEVTELKEGAFKAQRVLLNADGEVEYDGDEIYAERISLTPTGLTGRLHKRLIEHFKKEG